MKRLVTAGAILPPMLGLLLAATAAAANDFEDIPYLQVRINQVLESEPTGAEVEWHNEATGNSGAIRVLKTYFTDPDSPCRDYERTTRRTGGADRVVLGTGCRDASGRWALKEQEEGEGKAPGAPAQGGSETGGSETGGAGQAGGQGGTQSQSQGGTGSAGQMGSGQAGSGQAGSGQAGSAASPAAAPEAAPEPATDPEESESAPDSAPEPTQEPETPAAETPDEPASDAPDFDLPTPSD